MHMKSEDKEVNINEVAIALEVDSDVIDKVRSGGIGYRQYANNLSQVLSL